MVGPASCRVEAASGERDAIAPYMLFKSAGHYNQIFVIPATTQMCRLGSAAAGTYPVSVSFPSLGNSRSAGEVFFFTYQLILSSFSPLSGSVAG